MRNRAIFSFVLQSTRRLSGRELLIRFDQRPVQATLFLQDHQTTRTKTTAMTITTTSAATRRSSHRIRGLPAASDTSEEVKNDKKRSVTKRASGTRASSKNSSSAVAASGSAAAAGASKKRKTRKSVEKATAVSDKATDTSTTAVVAAVDESTPPSCLPRTHEMQLNKKYQQSQPQFHVMGIDEAGRGPLAGPVVAAAAIVPLDIAGIIDSKKLTKEEVREDLYEKIVASDRVRWAVAIVDAPRIDEINILQATLQGMRMAATALMGLPLPKEEGFRLVDVPDSSISGCYLVCSGGPKNESTNDSSTSTAAQIATKKEDSTAPTMICSKSNYCALIDGNRLPKDMPCEAETMVKGDAREYCIAAASILAKVTRDRLMHEYDRLYPVYNLKQHKGYPTAFHMEAVRMHGATLIHRRTFAPLKHMEFDESGKVVDAHKEETANANTEKKRKGRKV